MTITQNKETFVRQFIDDLRQAREKGMTGAELARRFGGLHRNVVNQWLDTTHRYRPHFLVVKALRPTLDEIMEDQKRLEEEA